MSEPTPDIAMDLARDLGATIPTAIDTPFAPPAGGRCVVNTLPPELLAHIFWIGKQLDNEEDLEDDESELSYSDSDEDTPEGDFQVLVSHVCAHWRSVALDTPLLWAEIAFTSGVPFDKARTYISRTKGAPLSIDIDADADGDEESEDEASASSVSQSQSRSEVDHDRRSIKSAGLAVREPFVWGVDEMTTILDIIIPHVARWRELQMMVNTFDLMHTALLRMSGCGPAPLLEVLLLYHHEDWNDDEFESTYGTLHNPDHRVHHLLFGGQAPALRNLTLWGVHLDWNSPFMSGLRDLELSWHPNGVRPSWSQFARILASSPDLEVLQLSGTGPRIENSLNSLEIDWPFPYGLRQPEEGGDNEVTVTSVPIDLPSVIGFNISSMPPKYAIALVRRLAFPSLRTLSLDLDGDIFDEFVSQLLQLPFSPTIPPPHPNKLPHPTNFAAVLGGLTTLVILDLPCTSAKVVELYRAVPNVRFLRLNIDHLGLPFADSLIWRQKSSIAQPELENAFENFFPHLQSLQVSGLDLTRLAPIVQTRKEANVGLRELALCKDDDLYDNEEFLQKYVDTISYFSDEEEEEDLPPFLDLDDIEDEIDDEDEEEDSEEDEWTDEDDVMDEDEWDEDDDAIGFDAD